LGGGGTWQEGEDGEEGEEAEGALASLPRDIFGFPDSRTTKNYRQGDKKATTAISQRLFLQSGDFAQR
jgi:hypothetical protein